MIWGKEGLSGAAYGLGKIGDVRAVIPLTMALKDTNDSVRFSAIVALEKIADSRRVDHLIEVALKDQQDYIRTEAIKTLGKIRDPRSITWLVESLINWKIKREVAAALKKSTWEPRTDEDRVHFLVAQSDASQLRTEWNLVKRY